MSGRAVGGGLEPHRGAVAALRELALERAAQVVDFLLVDEQVAVARDAELVAAEHLHAREQPRRTKASTMADSSTKRRRPPPSGSGTMRGSERGACTIASSLSRPKASLPDRRTMKFRLLFWMRGKGRAGSRPSGLSTGSTSAAK